MKLNKFLSLLFLLLVLTVSSYASDSCFITEPCTWYAYGAESELGVNITFYYDNLSEIGTYAMDSINTGKYLYNISFIDIGNVMGCAKAYNSTGYFAESCESKLIELRPTVISGESSMSLSPLFTILGVAIIAALLLFIAFKLDESHIYWKLITLAMVFLMLIFIPAAGIDGSKDCSRVPTNSTVTNGVTEYNYDMVCSDEASATSVSFYKLFLWVFRLAGFYTMLYIFLTVIGGLGEIPKRIEKLFNRRK